MQLTNDPVPLNLSPNTDLLKKLRIFIGHFDLRVYVSDRAYVDVGRGSFTAASMVRYVSGSEGCVGKVGQFTNVAEGTVLFGVGEHRNHLPVNVVFNPVFMLARAANDVADLKVAHQEPFEIGNAVLISAHVKVLGGARIGDGAVVAAAAVAAGELEPFTIHGGVPAKAVRARLDQHTRAAVEAVRWWDFDFLYLARNMHRLQELAVDTASEHVYRRPTPRLVLKVPFDGGSVSLMGFLVEDVVQPLAQAPPKVQQYLQQLVSPGPYYWLADMWTHD